MAGASLGLFSRLFPEVGWMQSRLHPPYKSKASRTIEQASYHRTTSTTSISFASSFIEVAQARRKLI